MNAPGWASRRASSAGGQPEGRGRAAGGGLDRDQARGAGAAEADQVAAFRIGRLDQAHLLGQLRPAALLQPALLVDQGGGDADPG